MHQEKPPCKGAAIGLPNLNVSAVLKTAAAVQGVMADMINADGSLTPEGIRALLRGKNISIKILAETNGFADSWIHQIINREYPDIRVRKLLAKAIDIPYECLWGEVANAS